MGCLIGITLFFGVEFYKPWLLEKIIHPLTQKNKNKQNSLKRVT